MASSKKTSNAPSKAAAVKKTVSARKPAAAKTAPAKSAAGAGKSPMVSRSSQWFARDDIYGFIYRSWTKNRGIPHDQFDGRPVIGICNTWSELTPCNSHFRLLADQVRQGVLEAGGFPLEFPVTSLGETLVRPTAMLLRNLASMDVEETIRANDGSRDRAAKMLDISMATLYRKLA